MDNVKEIFNNLEVHYKKRLPFVVYSRPINSIIKCWLQKDNVLHKTDSYEEKGFVFAPFDQANSAILFPKSDCDHHIIEANKLDASSLSQPSKELSAKDRTVHIDLVSRGVSEINSGTLQKVVLSRVEKRNYHDESPIEIFKRLFNSYKNAMVYCWYHPKVGLWLGATPELLFKVVGNQLTSISLAGTQAYEEGKKPLWTKKELDEQQIVTDFLAEQIKPFTTDTKVSEVESIRAGKLWHLKTRLISGIKTSSNLKSIIQALHPTPAVCGFPKEEAKEFILRNEGYQREFYTGFLGELNLTKTTSRNTNRRNLENNAYGTVKKLSNFYVNLRCMQIKGNEVHIYVGGGVTKDSSAEKEFEETLNKAKTISAVLK